MPAPPSHCAWWLARVARSRPTALALVGDEAQHGRFRRARAAARWRHSGHTLWKGTARARGRRSVGARPLLPRASLPSHCAWWLARVARSRSTAALALVGDEAQHGRFRRARAAARWRHSGHTLWKGTARARGRRSVGARPLLPRASLPSHCAWWLARVARSRSTAALALVGDEAQHGRFRRARAAARWRHSVHTLWKGTARARGRRSVGARPLLPRASLPSHCAWWLARVARLRSTALALVGDEAQHGRFRRARAAARWRHSGHTLWKGTARARGRRSVGARPLLPRASLPSHCAWWLARVARLRSTALALVGDEAQHGRFRRARAAVRWRHSVYTQWKGTARARGRRSVGARLLLPRASPPLSLRVVACACSALAPYCARSRWGRGPARALPPRARRGALATLGPYAMEGHCTRERPPFRRRQAPAPTCQPSLSLRVVACACSALALYCGARSRWGRGPARALPPRARRGALATLGAYAMEGHCTRERPPFRRRQAPAPTGQPSLSLRVVACACSALALYCARSRWGRGPARALPPRARRGALATLGPYAMEGHCTRERPPFRRRQAPAPTGQPSLSLRVVACACSALALYCARSRWGRGPARALPTRTRRGALAALGSYAMEGHCTSERPPFRRRQAPAPTCQPPPLTARGGLRV